MTEPKLYGNAFDTTSEAQKLDIHTKWLVWVTTRKLKRSCSTNTNPKRSSSTRRSKSCAPKGYSATRIEDVCAEAGLTKGSFFHHFKSKEDLALSAVAHWDATTSAFFATAPYHDAADPLSRMIAYIEFRKAILTGDLPDFTCFVGTIVQETYQTHPEVSAAAAGNISSHARTLEADIARRCASTALLKTGRRRASPCTPRR